MIKRLRIEIILSIVTIIFLSIGTSLSLMGIFELGVASLGVAILGASHLLMISREQVDALMFKYFIRHGCDICGSKEYSNERHPVICYTKGIQSVRFLDINILCWDCFSIKCPYK